MRGGIVTLLCLAVGLGVGYLLGASAGPDPRGRARTTAPRPADVAADMRPSGDTLLAQAIRELPLPPMRRGSGTIVGRVMRPDGAPVAGVTVIGTLRERDEWREHLGGPPPVPDIEEEVRRLVAGLRRWQLNQLKAVTDGDGRYALQEVADGDYDVSAYLMGFRVTAVGRGEARAGGSVDFTAEPVVRVEFRIVMPDGSVAPDATVRVKSANGTSGHGWRSEQPVLLLRPGDYVCSAERGESEEYRSSESSISLAEGAAAGTVVIRLEGRPGIRGTVSFSKDLPFARATVYALAFAGEKAPDAEVLVAQGKQDGTRTGSGTYRLLDLPRGRYLVGAALDRTVVATQVVEVVDRIETCDFRVDSIDPAHFVVVRVLDASGKPVTDVSFGTAYRTERSSHSNGGATTARRPDGSFLLLHQPHDQPEGGTYFVKATSPQYGEKEVGYRKGEGEVLVRFSDPATLDLVIAGFARSEYAASVTVGLFPRTADENTRFGSAVNSKAPDSEGRLSFGPVESGEYRVILYAGGGVWHDRITVTKHATTLAPGKNVTSIPMPRLYALVVADTDGKQGQSLSLRPEAGDSWGKIRATLDETLRARFAPLPEGTYQLRRDAEASGAMRVTVRGDAEITFRPTPCTALRLTISDPTCACAKAGLLDGDLVVAVDGDEFESPDELQLAYASLRTKEKATLGILRGGGRVEVRVAAKELFAAGAGGAQVEWASR